jgi:hypothetical protein
MALTLYHYNSSVCSEKVRMVLHEKGETGWESHEVDLFTGGQFDPQAPRSNRHLANRTLQQSMPNRESPTKKGEALVQLLHPAFFVVDGEAGWTDRYAQPAGVKPGTNCRNRSS